MINSIIKKFHIVLKRLNLDKEESEFNILNKFFKNGQIPWSEGYLIHKKKSILMSISTDEILNKFSKKEIPENYGYRLDERIVEYPWILSNLNKDKTIFLDAGSTFNYDYLLNNRIVENKEKYIYTFYPEDQSYYNKRISYVYGDLRDLPFRNHFFDEIVCQSTIEHIDMDNSMYGYDLKSTLDGVINKSYEYLKVVDDLLRVLKFNGNLLLTFPYGRFENHGFFQQFDNEMLERITFKMREMGSYEITFFKYLPDGWIVATQEDCNESESFNPHTGKGKKEDFAAHSRAICCIKFCKAN